jgi:hypothetical protein
MSDSFNGYHVWLGIPPSEQPPNHYRLLGIAIFETDLDVIDHAADRQMAHVRTFQSGRNGGLSQRILNELAAARVCLLNAQRKVEYDDDLRAKLSSISSVASVVPTAVAPMAVPVGVAVPMAQPAIATPVLAQPTVPNRTGAAGQSGIHAKPSNPGKPAGGGANPTKSGTYAMPPGVSAPAARAPQTSSPSSPGSSANLSGIAPAVPVAPIQSAPVQSAPVQNVPSAAVKPAGSTPPPRPTTVPKPPAGNGADDDDPYGLAAASRRPLASRNLADDDDDADDDMPIRQKVGGGVDLSLRSGNRDALVQKLAVYGFVVVAVLVIVLVTKNVVESNYGPIDKLFNQPAVEQPVAVEPDPIHAPAAPLPAPAAGAITDESGDPSEPATDAAAPIAKDATGGGNDPNSIPTIEAPDQLEAPADLESPADLNTPQLEEMPASPAGS